MKFGNIFNNVSIRGIVALICVLSSLTTIAQLFTSCAKNDNYDKIIDARLKLFAGTKTTISENRLFFEVNDEIGFYAEGLHNNVKFIKNTDDNFYGKLPKIGEFKLNTNYYAYYPYSEKVNGTIVTGEIRHNQIAPFDASMNYMVGDVITAVYDEGSMPILSFYMQNQLTSIIKIRLINTNPLLQEEKIKSLRFYTPECSICGEMIFDVSKGKDSTPEYFPVSSDNVLLQYEENKEPVLGLEEVHDLYVFVRPCSVEKISLIVTTTNYHAVIESENNFVFDKGTIINLPPLDVSTMNRYSNQSECMCVFMGDSITWVWRQKSYTPTHVETGTLFFHPYFFMENQFDNVGITAEKTHQMLARFQTDVIDKHPKAVHILGGINDLQGGVSPEEAFNNIKSMAEMATAAGIKVVIGGVLPYGKSYSSVIQSFNAELAAYCTANGFSFIDYYTPLADTDGSFNMEYSYDGLHPNPTGCTIMENLCLQTILTEGGYYSN